jgi:hypothetical protein
MAIDQLREHSPAWRDINPGIRQYSICYHNIPTHPLTLHHELYSLIQSIAVMISEEFAPSTSLSSPSQTENK